MDSHPVVIACGPWYTFLYNLAFVAGFCVLLYEGYSRKYPALKWILLLAATQISIIAGSKLITYSAEEWNFLLTHFSFPPAENKALIGGLLAGTAMLYSGRYLLRFRQNPADAFAIALPLTLAIQRAGCFISGCCFGKISGVPWAVRYPVNSLPHFHHFNDALIPTTGYLSLPVHPVQLYEMALLLLLVVLVIRFRKKFIRSGSLMMFSFAGLLAARGFTEFFRDPHAHTFGGQLLGVLNVTQWIAFTVMIAFLCFLYRIEKRKPLQPVPAGGDIPVRKALPAVLLVMGIAWFVRHWFVLPERIAILPVILCALGVFIYKVVRETPASSPGWLYLAALVLPFFLLAQNYPDNHDGQNLKRFKTLKFGFATGHFENSHNIGTGEGCDRISKTEYFDQKYLLAGAAYETTRLSEIPFEQISFGIQSFIGKHTEIRISDSWMKEKLLVGLTPYVRYETNWLGMGGGLHFGNLGIITENQSVEGTEIPTTGSSYHNIYPQIYLRIGPRRWGYVDFRLADQFPSALPGFRYQFGIGSGLGQRNETSLRIGTSVHHSLYLSGVIPFEKKIILEPMFMWVESPRLYAPKGFYQLSLGLGYKFGYHDNPKKTSP